MLRRYILFFCVCFSLADIKIPATKRPKLVIDNDAGGDDAMAIFLAVLNEKHFDGPQLIGLTTVNGNTCEDNVYVNNQRILKVANRQDIPIYRGSKSSLVHTPDGGTYFGQDGLGDTGDVYTDLVPAKPTNAVQALIELSKTYKDELTVITLGSLTNVALAIKMDPDFLNRLDHLYVAAGHINDESNKDVEFNLYMDVEAYHVVVQNANVEKVTFFPFSQVMEHLNISREWREQVFGAIDSDIVRAQNKFERLAVEQSDRWQALDPAAIAVVVRPDLVTEYKYTKQDVGLCDTMRGIVRNDFVEKNKSTARLVYSVNEEQYKEFLLDVFSADKIK
ncbi:unnamed protein product [Chilo suppressalis]|uniref:Inosine/uridine-preferring nucleoside hydrolase domain-containing protein n=1 Tax=Chilo suppressalis TaxID=168631 RepID=A0ABN8L7D4_CHISP|nr:hypothetical protein evm_003317 [Chilo suppressalis]CAH2990310.1 unnamed protein product [Chilo suppressalis]